MRVDQNSIRLSRSPDVRPRKPGAARQQQGLTAVLMALLLTGLCGTAALAVDVGVLISAKNGAQNAADAAALAGAFTFLNPTSAQPAAAQQAAVAIGNTNAILDQPLSLTSSDVSVSPANREVTVVVNLSGSNAIPMFFARVLGIFSEPVKAVATAQASPYASGSMCLRPIFVPNTILSTEPPAQACADGQTVFGANGLPSPWLESHAGLYGSQFVIRPTNPSVALAPSQFYSLDFGAGASAYGCTIGDTLADCAVTPAIAACGTAYPTETGDMVGPTRQGITTLLGASPDRWVGPGAYANPAGVVTDTSHQLIVAPVWDDCSQTVTSGASSIVTIGYSEWFIEGMSGGGVQADFVNAAGCPANGGGSGNGAGENAAFGIPVRLVTPSS